MGLLNFFSKPAPSLPGLPTGSFTVDRTGRIVIGTIPSTFPSETIKDIGMNVIQTFREAQAANLPLAELVIHFGGLKITARELRGGAIVFLSPKNTISAES